METPSEAPKRKLGDRFLGLIESTSASDRLILRIIFFVVIFSGIWTALSLNDNFSELTPTQGGSITEGILGTPRYINPVLATTRADQDATAVIYSGLMKIDPQGRLVNDIAEEINISEDGLIYNIKIRKDLKFHDNTPLSARDVVYTIGLIQDPDLKSPLRGHWTDVVVEELGEYEINIVLEEAYAPFIENFTVGIMPAHAWSSLPIEQIPFSQLNTEPIGSGPFAISEAKRSSSGLVNQYILTAFQNPNVNPKISQLELIFFETEDEIINAVANGEIDATTYIPQVSLEENISDEFNLIEKPLPRTFGIFFNQNKSSILRDEAVREALEIVLDKEEIIEVSFNGYGVPISTPTGINTPTIESGDTEEENASTTSKLDQAREILESGGWEQNDAGLWETEISDESVILSVTLRTSNRPLFESMSKQIADQWTELGVDVTTEQFEQTGLVQSVIRPRDFQALLFGHDMSRSYDLYPIWHSSQKDDPGLNVAQYTNLSVDELLEDALSEQNESERMRLLEEASAIIYEETPAVLIAQPTLTYLVNKEVTLPEMNRLGRPSDRFSNISDWHTETDSLWPFFRKNME